jgi:hypothetical protein
VQCYFEDEAPVFAFMSGHSSANQAKKVAKKKFALQCCPTQARITLVKKQQLIVCDKISKFKVVGEKHVQFKVREVEELFR